MPCAMYRDLIPAQAVAKETRDKDKIRGILIWYLQVQVGLWTAYLTGLGLRMRRSAVCASGGGL